MTLAPRWRKLIGDFNATRGRIALMLAALVIGMFTITTIAGSYAFLSRVIARNYLDTNPASALIDVGEVTPEILAAIAADPDIAAAEPASIVVARSRAGEGAWHRTLLFIVPDFSSSSIGQTFPEDGSIPPADGTVLVEREAMGFLGAVIGDDISIQTSGGTTLELPVAAYIYLTSRTAAQLGLPLAPELVKVIVRDADLGQSHVDAVVGGVARGQGPHELHPRHGTQRVSQPVRRTNDRGLDPVRTRRDSTIPSRLLGVTVRLPAKAAWAAF